MPSYLLAAQARKTVTIFFSPVLRGFMFLILQEFDETSSFISTQFVFFNRLVLDSFFKSLLTASLCCYHVTLPYLFKSKEVNPQQDRIFSVISL